LKLADNAVGAKNFEEAYRYFSQILEEDLENPYAILGKGFSAGCLVEYVEASP